MVRLRPVWMTNHPPSVLWHCWLGHQTCKNRRPYNLYCVGADVKPCSIRSADGGCCHSGSCQPGWPGLQVHWLSGGRLGMSAVSLAMWPKRALRRWLTLSEINGRPVVAEITSFWVNWCYLVYNNCPGHFIMEGLQGSGVDRENSLGFACV